MNVSEIKIYGTPVLVEEDYWFMGYMSFIINDSFFIGDVKIYRQGNSWYKLFYPSKQIDKNGEKKRYYYCYPINKEAGKSIFNSVLPHIREKFEENYNI